MASNSCTLVPVAQSEDDSDSGRKEKVSEGAVRQLGFTGAEGSIMEIILPERDESESVM